MKPFGVPRPRSTPVAPKDFASILWGVLSGLVAFALYLPFSEGVVGPGILWAVLGMALAASVFTLNGLGWGARPEKRNPWAARCKVIEILPPRDVLAIWPEAKGFSARKFEPNFDDTPHRNTSTPRAKG